MCIISIIYYYGRNNFVIHSESEIVKKEYQIIGNIEKPLAIASVCAVCVRLCGCRISASSEIYGETSTDDDQIEIERTCYGTGAIRNTTDESQITKQINKQKLFVLRNCK